MSGGRGVANLVMKCKACKTEGSASKCFLFHSTGNYTYQFPLTLTRTCPVDFITKPVAYSPENQDYTTIVKIECRGLELIGFEPRSGWKAKGEESGTLFEDIDLTSGDWADYDEKVRSCCQDFFPLQLTLKCNLVQAPKRVVTDPFMLSFLAELIACGNQQCGVSVRERLQVRALQEEPGKEV